MMEKRRLGKLEQREDGVRPQCDRNATEQAEPMRPQCQSQSQSQSQSQKEKTDADAIEIYQAYPRKVGKPKAIAAIKKAMASRGQADLLELTKKYAKLRGINEPQFIPHPATWFNQERYNDDPETWRRTSNEPKKKAAGYSYEDSCIAPPRKPMFQMRGQGNG